MDMIKLDPNNFRPTSQIEGLSSAIWTERFQEAGDFQLVTPYVDKVRNLLPEETLVSHQETKEVMIVESLVETESETGERLLTVTGRSFETFLENRVFEFVYFDEKWALQKELSAADAAMTIAWNAVVNPSTSDVTGKPWTAKTEYDAIPNLRISDRVLFSQAARKWWVEAQKDMYATMMDILRISRWIGVRNVRPLHGQYKDISVHGDGEMERQIRGSSTSLHMEFFSGLNRIVDQHVNTQVVFHHEGSDIQQQQYLKSIRDWRNMAWVTGRTKAEDEPLIAAGTAYFGAGGGPTASGRNKRMMLVDAGTQPKKMTTGEWNQFMKQKGAAALAEKARKRLFSGAISNVSQYKYKTNYDLGDTVTLWGRGDYKNTMVVQEYVRTHDESGDRGYPTLGFVREDPAN